MKILVLVSVVLFSAGLSTFLGADSFTCSKNQSTCETSNRDLTIGDKVIFLTDDNLLVAKGVVKKINQGKRVIKITKQWGKISKNHYIKVVNLGMKERYKVVKEKSNRFAGFNLGVANYDIGSSISGFDISGFYEEKFFKDLKWIGKMHFLTGSGSVTRTSEDEDGGLEEGDLRFSGFGFNGGISHNFLEPEDFQIRVEGTIGFTMLSADIDGDRKTVKDGGWDTGIEDGFGLNGGLKVSALFAVSDYTMEAYGQYTLLFSAVQSVFGVGMVFVLN